MDEQTSGPRIAILGIGLIGGSIGLSLKASSGARSIAAWDPDVESCSKALRLGAVDTLSEGPSGAASQADIVVLCPPLPDTLRLLREIAPALSPGAVVTDVGSLKAAIVEEADRQLAGRFVGGHPMAGNETSGIDSARPDLFCGAPWLLTPTSRTSKPAVEIVAALVRSTGARPRLCDPDQHDRVVAALSHLPHLLAYGLAHAAKELVPEDWRDVAAGSFRDGTRVAASDPELWRVVFRDNRESLLASLDAFDQWTSDLRGALELGDDERVCELLRQAREAKRAFSRGG